MMTPFADRLTEHLNRYVALRRALESSQTSDRKECVVRHKM
jgi:hypothetical protein